jgi:hypothetical protein
LDIEIPFWKGAGSNNAHTKARRHEGWRSSDSQKVFKPLAKIMFEKPAIPLPQSLFLLRQPS